MTVTVVDYCCECHKDFESNPHLVAMCPNCKLPTEKRETEKLWKFTASLVGQRMICKVLVAGESAQKAVNLRWTASCECGQEEELDLSDNDSSILRIVTHVNQPETVVLHQLPKSTTEIDEKGQEKKHMHNWVLLPGPASDFRNVKVRDLVEMEEGGDKAVTTREYPCIMLLKLPSEKKLIVDGLVLIHPKNDDLILLVHDCAPLMQEAQSFSAGDLEKLHYLQNQDFDNLRRLIDSTVAPDIVGRERAKLASAVTVLGVNWLPPLAQGQNPLPGCTRTWMLGDSKTGKGTIIRWWHESAGLGEYGVGETASRAGLSYYVDVDTDVIVWGLLVQADLGLAVIEGMHGLSPEEIPQFREILHQQRIEVRKKVSGVAWARARILADANSMKPLKEYALPCLAILQVPCLPDPADVTRIDLAVPFADEDVPVEEREKTIEQAKRQPGIPVDLLRKLALWAWSRKTTDIEITDGAITTAQANLREFEPYKTGRIPLIHNGSLVQLLRVAAGFATLTFSSPDERRLIIKDDHVKMAAQLLRELLDAWALDDFVTASGIAQISPEEMVEIKTYVEGKDTVKKVLYALSFHRYPGKDLAARVDADYGYVRNVLSELRAKDLITRRNDGYDLSAKGASVARELILGNEKRPYEKVCDWVLKHKNHEGLIETQTLTAFITEEKMDVLDTLRRLRAEGLLTDANQLGSLLVLK
jgi:DNA-binding MarR family transcriptional regulator